MKKQICYLAIIVIFIPIFSFAQTWEQVKDRVKENTYQIESISEKVSDIKDNYHLLYEGSKNQNDQLSNQISFAGYLLGIFSLLLTGLGIYLAWHVNSQFEKIKEMKAIVEETKKAIEGNSTNLYKKLKKEETISYLMRLDEVPEDISNIISILLSRDMVDIDYLYIKKPYLKFKKIIPLSLNGLGEYQLLLIQHFLYQSLGDTDLKNDIMNNLNNGNLNHMFAGDIKNLFDQSLKYLTESSLVSVDNKDFVKNLFYKYFESKFSQNSDLRSDIISILEKYGMKTEYVYSILKEKKTENIKYAEWLELYFI